MTRRSAFKAILAGLAVPFVGRKAQAKPCEFSIPVKLDAEQIERLKGEFIPQPSGVLGETYFRCGVKPQFPIGTKRLYFDGVDVTELCNECDTVGGWVRMYDVDAAGKRLPRVRTKYGRVEIVDRPWLFLKREPVLGGHLSIPVSVPRT